MATNSYIQPVSETDTSKGTSSQSTPTSSQEAERLNKLRSITSSSSGRRKRSTSSSLSSSTQSSNSDSLRNQYIKGASQPVSMAPSKVDISPTRSTTQRVAREQLVSTSVSTTNLKGEEIVIDKAKTASTINKGYVPYSYAPSNAIRSSDEELTKATRKAERQENIDITAKEIFDFDRKPDFNTLKGVPALAGRTAYRFGEGVVQSFNVYAIGEGVITTGAGLVEGSITGEDIKQGISQSFIDNPAGTVGSIVGPGLIFKGLKAGAAAKVRTGKYVEPTTIYGPDQIVAIEQGVKPTLPKTSSTAESLRLFESTRKGKRNVPDYERTVIVETNGARPKDYLVATDDYAAVNQKVSGYQTEGSIYSVTSSPSALKGGISGEGYKASIGAEGPGIYVAPLGKGSAAFLRLGKDGSKISFSIVPNKGLLDVPTATIVKSRKAILVPEEVTRVPGFSEEKVFSQSRAGKGEILIGKRSQIGQGEITRQYYEAPMDYVDPWSGKRVSKGEKVIEKGTTELEGNIPFNDKFVRYKPDEFTTIDKNTIRVRNVEQVIETPKGNLVTSSGRKISPGEKVFTGEQLNYEQSSLVSSVQSNINLNPSSFVPRVTSNSLNGLSSTSTSTPVLSESSFTGSSSGSGSNFRPSSNVPDNIGSSSPVSDSLRDYNFSGSSGGRRSGGRGGGSTPYVPPPPRPINYGSSSTPSKPPSKNFFGGSSVPSSVPPKIQPGLPQPTYYKPKTKNDKPTYIVQVRRKGTFGSIFRTTNKEVAYRVGESEIKGRSSASFRILKDNTILDTDKQFKQLYGSAKEKGVYIEKREFRINSPGEKAEITLKGIFSDKKKKKKGFSFF